MSSLGEEREVAGINIRIRKGVASENGNLDSQKDDDATLLFSPDVNLSSLISPVESVWCFASRTD